MDRKIEKKGGLTRKNILYGVIVLLVLFITGIMIFGDKSSKYNVEVARLTIDEVKRDIFQDYITDQGIVEPIRTIYLDAVEGGRVEEILIDDGNMVKEGDVILRLSNNNLLLEITNNEAQVVRAVNELRTARLSMDQQKLSNKQQIIQLSKQVTQEKRAYENNRQLFAENHISQETFDQSREAFQASLAQLDLVKENYRNDSLYRSIQINSLESSVKSMEKSMGIIRKRLENLNVKAPADGELATLNPEIGQVISYGTRVGTVNILDSYKLRVEIDEHYIARIHTGLKGECDFASKSYPAEIVKIYPEVQNGRFAVDMEFTDSIPDQIRIGQASRIRLQLGESREGLLLAKGGFYNKTGGQWVFVVDPSGEFAEKREITIGRQNPRYYEVLEGLEAGEQVITSSYQNFADHDKLILKNN
ncbi:MAG: HlyD family efflux transporter periplasmic adaptor subunit [Bacteroidales bacterium]|nr:HlyD family efflux transporter periplasmic adaptor subunit [Bacteroidales bacterium]MDT8431678.1 HlyD family efflux transporter periplasmic adaptor subunit [Bacteroidales bacterium]